MRRSSDTFIFSAELGARLRDLRLKSGLTQLELGNISLPRLRERVELFPHDPRPKR